MGDSKLYDRYARQIILKGFGEEAQSKLHNAHVLVVGSGGLGCPVLQYLVAAGIGQLTIVDDDIISMYNLHRQVLFDESNIGELKVDVAKRKLNLLNKDVTIHAVSKRLTPQLAIELFPAVNIIVDATDNFATRYIINDGCVLMNKPLVFGAVSMYEGQVAVFNSQLDSHHFSVNYRDLFPVPLSEDTVLNCEEAGVIGALAGIIGSMQALEVIKLLSNIGQPLVNKLLTYNSLNQQVFTIDLVSSEVDYVFPKNLQEYIGYDYVLACKSKNIASYEIEVYEFEQYSSDALIIDVREFHEEPRLNKLISKSYLEIPLSCIESEWIKLKDSNLIFICQSGKRSKMAVEMMLQHGHEKKLFSLKNGIGGFSKKI